MLILFATLISIIILLDSVLTFHYKNNLHHRKSKYNNYKVLKVGYNSINGALGVGTEVYPIEVSNILEDNIYVREACIYGNLF